MQRYRIEFADDLMMVVDQDNNGHDAHVVRPGHDGVYEAKMKINEWKTRYPTIDTVKSKREVNRLVDKMQLDH